MKPQRRAPVTWPSAPGILGAAVAIALATLISPSLAFASGDEKTSNGDDLLIGTDSRWAGGVAGGYLPIRVRVTNHGPPRDLTFEFEPFRETGGVRARRSIGVDQNATVQFTLPVPLVDSRDGTLHVYEGSREIKAHSRSISVPSGPPALPSPPAMLVISSSPVDCSRFVDVWHHLLGKGGPHYGVPTVDASLMAQVVAPSLLPDSWIDYSGLDFVAISREELERLDHSVRTAILKWVQCGGNLVVYEVGNDPQSRPRLDRLIDAPGQTSESTAWRSAVVSQRPSGELKDETTDESTVSGGPSVRFERRKTSKSKPGTTKPPEHPWQGGADAFRSRDLMLGTVWAFSGNPFPGTVNDWLWLCQSCGQERWSWPTRHGMSPHIGSQDFYKFMNAGIHGVPTIAFLVLITLFSVVIGPVNYIYLSRKKMLWLLLVTVPVLAFTTSGLLLGYSVAAHGFAVKSRIRSLTVLDQRNQTAVTMARLALFAGVSPSGGLRFSPETAVFPVIPTTNDPTGGFVDWTETQNLVTGWLPARTRTQFYTVRNAEQRARVELKPAAPRTAEFRNGLPWELEMIVACDDSGHFYVGKSIPAGASAVLSEPTSDELSNFVALLGRNAPALPNGFVQPAPSIRNHRTWMPYGFYGGTTDFGSNLMERRISRWSNLLPKNKGLEPRSYVAVLRENPGVETGVSSTSDALSLHVLNGYF
jgi:hypothetical protein